MDIFDFIAGLLTFSAGFLAGAFWVSAKGADARADAQHDALMRLPLRSDADLFVRATDGPDPSRVRPATWASSGRRPII